LPFRGEDKIRHFIKHKSVMLEVDRGHHLAPKTFKGLMKDSSGANHLAQAPGSLVYVMEMSRGSLAFAQHPWHSKAKPHRDGQRRRGYVLGVFHSRW